MSISQRVWDTLELCEAHLDDNRLYDAGGRCSMCGKKTNVTLDVIHVPGEEDFLHWVCEGCLAILHKARKNE